MTSMGPPLQRVAQAPSEPLVQLCAFRVGSEEYVLDLRRVEEIVRSPGLTRVPRAPSFIDGVIHFRGAILPAVDLRKRLLAGAPPPGTTPKCMICRLGRERVAILVEAMSGVVRLPRSELKPAPPLLAAGARPYVLGVCGQPEKPKLLLDLKALFQPGPPGVEGGAL